jgi:hypothetical protein
MMFRRNRTAAYRQPVPTTQTFTDAQLSGAFFGYFDTTTTAGRRLWDSASSAMHLQITGTDATMAANAGATAFQVSVDGGAWTTPTISANVLPLFSGLSDTTHSVQIAPNNTFPAGNWTPTTGVLISVKGLTPTAVATATQQWHVLNGSSPIISTHAQGAAPGGNYLPALGVTVSTTGFGTSGGSSQFRAKHSGVYVFTAVPEIWYSIDGGTWTKQTLTRPLIGAVNRRSWQKLNITASPSAYQSVIVSDSPSASKEGQTLGVMVGGTGADIQAPSASKTYVTLFGASQVEGVGATIGSVDIHRLQVLFPGLAGNQHGLAGATITLLNSSFATIMGFVPAGKRQTAILSIGINSADDASFQGDYQTLIGTVLAAGYTKVICRGLVQVSSNASKNAKIQAAVAAVGNPAVTYADVSTWTAATTDTGSPVIVMPDGSHPNDLGYDRLAQLVLRDHLTLLP